MKVNLRQNNKLSDLEFVGTSKGTRYKMSSRTLWLDFPNFWHCKFVSCGLIMRNFAEQATLPLIIKKCIYNA